MFETGMLLFVGFLIVMLACHFIFEGRRKAKLEERYKGNELGHLIVNRKICQGMSQWELLESWGEPDAKEKTVLKSKKKETWMYGRAGRGYLDRVFLENGYVVGWKQIRK